MQSLHRQEHRKQELISEFGSNLRNRKTPSFYPQINSFRPKYQAPVQVQEVVKKVKTCHISQRYRPIAATCLSRKTVAKGRKNLEEDYDSAHVECPEETEFNDRNMRLPMKARSRMMAQNCGPRNVYESNPLLRVPNLMEDDMMGLSDEELEDEESDEAPASSSRSFLPKTTSGQRMKFGLAVLMIPSLIVIMNGHKKFNSSNSNVDYSGMAGAGGVGLGAIGGHGAGGHGMGGFGRGGGGGVGGMPGMGMDDDPLDALGYPGPRKGKRNRKGRKGKKSRKNPFDPFEDTLEGKMKQMMGGVPGIDAQEQLDKIQQLQEQYKKSKTGMMDNDYLDRDREGEDDDHEDEGEDQDDGVSVNDDGAEVDLSPGSEYMEPFGAMGLDYPNGLIDFPKVPKTGGGNPDPGLKSEVLTEQIPTAPEEELSSKLAVANVPTLKTIGYKVILVWSDDIMLGEIPLGINSFTDLECESSKCVITRNKSHEFLSDSIIVTPKEANMPANRAMDQTWILYHSKPQSNFTNVVLSLVTNLTWSFMAKSNITLSNAKREELSKGSFSSLPADHLIFFKAKKLMEVWARKKKESKVVLYWADTCGDLSHSLLELFYSSSIGVEIVQNCPGSSICSSIMDEQEDIPFQVTMTDHDCYKKLLQDNYLFSLIEDHSTSKCSNYTSRKLLTSLESSAIPIAGVMTYNVVPDRGILNVNTLSKVELIHRMNNVMKDFATFKNYFEWKKKFRMTTNRNDLCQLCSYLHQESKPRDGFSVTQWLQDSKNCETWP